MSTTNSNIQNYDTIVNANKYISLKVSSFKTLTEIFLNPSIPSTYEISYM